MKKKKRIRSGSIKRKWLFLLPFLAAMIVMFLYSESVSEEGLFRSEDAAAAELKTGAENSAKDPATEQTDGETIPGEMDTEEIVTGETVAEEAITIDSQLPYMLEDGKLEISSVFRYTGLNPDCGWEDGSNIGALVLVNRSGDYLEAAYIELTMSDGSVFHFMIADVPAGKTIWAFDSNSAAFDDAAIITEAKSGVTFRTDDGLTPEQVAVAVEGTEVTLTNGTSDALENLEMHCHNTMDGAYFGGTSYRYPIEKIDAGGTVTVYAEDCFMGETEVTRIDYKD